MITLRYLLWFYLKQEGQDGRKHTVKRSSFGWVHCVAQQVPGPFCGVPDTMVIDINNKPACLSMPCQDLEIKEKVKSTSLLHQWQQSKEADLRLLRSQSEGNGLGRNFPVSPPRDVGRMRGTRYSYAPWERTNEEIVWAFSPELQMQPNPGRKAENTCQVSKLFPGSSAALWRAADEFVFLRDPTVSQLFLCHTRFLQTCK